MNNTTLNMVYLDDGKAIIKQKGNGGGEGESTNPTGAVNDVTFYDYDGAVLYGFSKADFLAIGNMPALPSHDGLICQGWNWDLAGAKTHVEQYGSLNIGTSYITDDGATRLHIVITAKGRQDFSLYFEQSVANGVTIDWGDGSGAQTLAGTGVVTINHSYTAIGNFTISLMPTDGCTLRLGVNRNTLNLINSSSDARCRVYFTMLKSVNIGKNVTSIGVQTFYNCYNLASITIPNGVTEIGLNAFYYCYNLASITIPNGVTEIGGSAFNSCYTLRSACIPKSVSSMQNYLFSNCQSLPTIDIPNGVTEIKPSVFSCCESLARIVIPASVATVQTFAFNNCYGAKVYDFSKHTSVPTLAGTNAFNGIPSDCVIIVPDALFDEWKAATNWSTYASKMVKASEYIQ